MTFDEAKAELIAEGYPANKIRRMKVQVGEDPENNLTEGVWPVFETSKGIRDEGDEEQGEPTIIRYKLDEGEIDPKRGEFWIPCVYHGNKSLVRNYCAPDWLESKKERRDFCERNYRKREIPWPDSGERASDPIDYLNDQLAASRITGLTASPDLTKDKRERMARDFARLNEIAFDYLSEAVEISLKKHEPTCRQFDRQNMRQGECLSEWHDQEAARIIELAFRAGKAAAQATLHYRGIPVFAEVGEPMEDKQAKKAPRKEWTRAARDFFRDNPKKGSKDLALHLKEQSLIDWLPQGPYEKAETICFYDGTEDDDETEGMKRVQFQKAVSKVKKSSRK